MEEPSNGLGATEIHTSWWEIFEPDSEVAVKLPECA